MKKKTIYNIIMVAVIAAIAAVAVFLAGRHLGWFDKADPAGETTAISATVRKGLANLERGGIASELKGQVQLREGDVVSVTSGYVAVDVDTCSLMLYQGSRLEIFSDEDAQVRLVTGEAFCQAADAPVKLQYGDHSATLQNAVLVCTVRTGSETMYVLGGTVSDGENTFTAGKTGCYVGQELSVQDMDLQALSSFALDCILGCEESMFCSADAVQAVLDSRNVPAEIIRPENPNTPDTPDTPNVPGTPDKPDTADKPGTPDTPATPDVPDKPDTPDTPDRPDTPDVPSTPDQPEPAGPTCTIEIRCDTILNNMKDLTPGLDVYVPDSGTILATTSVSFTAGETVFDVLKRICSERNIQIEYSYTPLYGSYYIEGINHLYEFDCGQQSGWMYKVNGWFPNYGCSSYKLEDGDTIVWCYTCKGLGTDVGAPSMG